MTLGKGIQCMRHIFRSIHQRQANKLFVSGECKTRGARKMSSKNTGLLLSNVVGELNTMADLKLAESWDNVGLLIEPTSPLRVNRILLTNDLTEPVMDEALNLKVDLIISYHPPIFAALKRITTTTWKERIVATCLENRIAVYSPHTAWDAVYGGVTDWLTDAFCGVFNELEKETIINSNASIENNYNAEVIGPAYEIEPVLKSLPPENIICAPISEISDQKKIFKIINCRRNEINLFMGLKETTVTLMKNEIKNSNHIGMGRIINTSGITVQDCVKRLKKHTGLEHLRLALGVKKSEGSCVSRIAVVPGSGGSLLRGVQADLYVTGEMFHHDILEANHSGISVILTNHSDSERGFLKKMKTRLETIFPTMDVLLSNNDKDPIVTV